MRIYVTPLFKTDQHRDGINLLIQEIDKLTTLSGLGVDKSKYKSHFFRNDTAFYY